MALIKSELTEYGVEAAYWKISMVGIDRTNNVGSFSLMLYRDREQSKSNPKKFFKDKVYYIDINIFPNILEGMTKDLYKIAYYYIKSTDEYFKDALNDEEVSL